jgi:hypothetical protein
VQHKENNMKTTVSKWAVKAAGAGAIALLLATPSFAQSRYDGNRNNSDRGRQTIDARNGANRSNDNGYRGNQNNNGYRQNQGVTPSGRDNSFTRQRDNSRGNFDRGQSYRAQPRYEDRGRDVRTGVSINLGGVFRGGAVAVGAGRWPNQYGRYGAVVVNPGVYANGFVRGVVERVDYRNGTILVLDDASGRVITADVAAGGYGLGNLRSGDYVQLTGQWIRGGVFDVTSINQG